MPDAPRVHTCSLLAPACRHVDFNEVYRPLLRERDGKKFGIGRMTIYNMDKERELEDTVTPLYRKSLLHLVSNACEEVRGERILGMQMFRRYLGNVPAPPIFRIDESDGSDTGTARTASRTHGGFDNDVLTMNNVLRSIVGGPPSRPFTKHDLEY